MVMNNPHFRPVTSPPATAPHANARAALVEAVHQWAQCMKANRSDLAQVEAEKILIFGRFVTEHKRFSEAFKQWQSPLAHSPRQVLGSLYAFLQATAEIDAYSLSHDE